MIVNNKIYKFLFFAKINLKVKFDFYIFVCIVDTQDKSLNFLKSSEN